MLPGVKGVREGVEELGTVEEGTGGEYILGPYILPLIPPPPPPPSALCAPPPPSATLLTARPSTLKVTSALTHSPSQVSNGALSSILTKHPTVLWCPYADLPVSPPVSTVERHRPASRICPVVHSPTEPFQLPTRVFSGISCVLSPTDRLAIPFSPSSAGGLGDDNVWCPTDISKYTRTFLRIGIMDLVDEYRLLPDLVAQCCPQVSAIAFPASCALKTARRDWERRDWATERVLELEERVCFSTRRWSRARKRTSSANWEERWRIGR